MRIGRKQLKFARINPLVGKDPVFALKDESPQYKEVLSLVESMQKDWDGLLTQKIATARQNIQKEIQQAQQAIDASLAENEKFFTGELNGKPLNRRKLNQIEGHIDNQIGFLSRQVHVRIDRALNNFSSSKGVIAELSRTLDVKRNELVNRLPETIVLIKDKKAQSEIPLNSTIFDLEENNFARICRENTVSSFVRYLQYIRCKKRIAKHYDIDELHIKSAFLSIQFTLLKSVSSKLLEKIEQHYSDQDSLLSDNWNGLRFGMESLAADVDDWGNKLEEQKTESIQAKIKESLDSIKTVADRLKVTLNTAFEECAPLFDEIESAITQSVEAYVLRLQQLLERESLENFSLRASWINKGRGAAGRVGRSLLRGSAKNHLQGLLHAVPDISRLLLDHILHIFKKEARTEATLEKLSDLPTDSEVMEGVRGLPAIYRRLFSTKPLTHQELMVGRNELIKNFVELSRKWRFGRAVTIAIIGPDGSGKTSLLNCFENEIEDNLTVQRLDFSRRLTSERELVKLFKNWFEIEIEAETIEALIPRLRELPRQAIFIRNGHNLLLRQIGGRRTVEAFLTILSATRDHFLWVVSFKEYPWSRLDYLVKISNYFSSQIKTLFHDKEELHEAILLRQRASGYDLEFIVAEEGIVGKIEEDEDFDQRQERFFTELFELTGGNMHSALFFWMLSLKITGDTCLIAQLPKLDFSFIRRLGREYLFTLTELLCHGGLSVEEHAKIFQLQSQRSRLQLEYLRRVSIVEGLGMDRNGAPAFYRINPVFYYPVVSSLRTLNILY